MYVILLTRIWHTIVSLHRKKDLNKILLVPPCNTYDTETVRKVQLTLYLIAEASLVIFGLPVYILWNKNTILPIVLTLIMGVIVVSCVSRGFNLHIVKKVKKRLERV